MDWGTDCHLLSIITQVVSCHLMKALAYRTIRLSTLIVFKRQQA